MDSSMVVESLYGPTIPITRANSTRIKFKAGAG